MQNEPNLENAQNRRKPFFYKDLRKIYPSGSTQKQTQNKPNQTQSKPNFSPKNGPQSQSKPNPSRRSLLVPAERFTKPGWRRRNEPNLSRRSLLVPAECFTKPGWRRRNEPNFQTKQIPLHTPRPAARYTLPQA